MKDRIQKLKLATEFISKKHKHAKKLISKAGECNFKSVGTPYEVLIKSVIGQQLSVRAASSIEKKLKANLGTRKIPHPKIILETEDIKFRESGLSYAKTGTLKRIAEKYNSKSISDKILNSLEDEKVLEVLCVIKGVGPWTSEMVLMFGLDRWDCFSIGDLGLRRGIENWFGIPRENKKEILEFVKIFSPYRTILSWYLWAESDSEPWE